MNSSQLKRWKDRQTEDAAKLVTSIVDPTPEKIKLIYPEFALQGAYTTSLDPYTPLWAVIPFFDKVIVGITPYFRTESAFVNWYGVTPRQLHALNEKGRVMIRVLFPSAAQTVPSFLNSFFSAEFPSTVRDRMFTEHLLGPDRLGNLKEKFSRTLASSPTDESIDTFVGNPGRAYKTAEAAYLQLHALGFSARADEFERLYPLNPRHARGWLEVCRLFLIGPVHYSLLGTHSVSSDAPRMLLAEQIRLSPDEVIKFPSELGRILVDTLGLIRVADEPNDFTLDDCIQIYPEFEEARQILLRLDLALRRGVEDQVISSSSDLRNLIRRGEARRRNWLRIFRWIGSTGLGLMISPTSSGLLAAMGFGLLSELGSEHVDKVLQPLAEAADWSFPEHLNLLLKLDDNVKKHYKGLSE